MPIVFVHGVANRPGPGFEKAKSQRAVFLRETVAKTYLKNAAATILQPMWGDRVPPLPTDNPVVPKPNPAGVPAFSGSASPRDLSVFTGVTLGENLPAENQRVLAIARQSFADAVDLLWHEAAGGADIRDDKDKEAKLIALGLRTSAYVLANPRPDWLDQVANDDEFVATLLEKSAATPPPPAAVASGAVPQAFGFFDDVKTWLTGAAQTVQKKVIDIPQDALLRQFRPGLTGGLLLFLGDVFFYQTSRGDKQAPGDIVKAVLGPLREASKEAKDKGEKLVVIGHSMGGIILYDILTHYAEDLKIDALVTVGSQASVFKQLQLFNNQLGGTFPNGTKAPKPANVNRWINIFDPQDFLSFAFEPEFHGVKDFYFESPGGVLSAHGDYFQRMRFYERLVARL